MKDRIKQIRKSQNLTQAAFGERIGVKANTITNYETGLRTPTDAVVLSMCREFNVNEHWLRTGEGDMFVTLSKEEEIAAFMGDILRDDGDEYKKDLVLALANLNDDGWKGLKMLIDNIIKSKQK